ncbi:unnamed protein product [Aphis gossypii]|uniref:Uncharacterized protein n=1 Tax=Aphis gossypii TaxID=80765 RepID=A0A9P0NCF0_APHGO|nr:unnamed protein product [Aphis gossypii]
MRTFFCNLSSKCTRISTCRVYTNDIIIVIREHVHIMFIRTHTNTLGHLASAETGIADVRSQPAHTKTLMTNLHSARSLYLYYRYRYTAGIQHLPTHALSSPVRVVTSSFYNSKQVPPNIKDLLGIGFLTFPPPLSLPPAPPPVTIATTTTSRNRH